MSIKELSERVGKCANTTKYVLGVCYALIFVLGFALFVASASARVSDAVLQTLHVPGIASLPNWGVCAGIFLALVALVGALGTFLLNRVLLIVFAALLAVLTVMQLTVGVTAYARQDQFPAVVSAAWDSAENSTKTYIQTTFACCGLDNTTDRPYLPGCPGYNASSSSASADEAAVDETVASSLYNGGCMAPILALAYRVANKVGAALLGITAFEVLTLIITAVLLCRIRKAKVNYSRMDTDPVENLLR
mgnify:CR=1 FL=1